MRNHAISLTAQERAQLQKIIALEEGKEYQIKRAQVLLRLDQIPENKGWTYEKICQALSFSYAAIRQLVAQFATGGIDGALHWLKTPWHKDLTGQRFDRLVVMRPLPQRVGGCIVWECKCDCGNIVARSLQQLKGSNDFNGLKSCGCVGRQDLTGLRFGRLVAIHPRPRQKAGEPIRWECKCDCGNTTVVLGASLCSGVTKSCGCIRRGAHCPDLLGQRFGMLTVLEHAVRTPGNRAWKCVCDCGGTCMASTSELTTGRRKSCGCINAELYRRLLKEQNEKMVVDGTNALLLCQKPRKTSESGVAGVWFDKARSKWIANIVFKKRSYFLGRYDKLEDAIKARKRAEEELYVPFLEWFHSQNNASSSSNCSEI